ncbi:hypothetical protein [Stackebrandtia soli]|uniref:hypothetical protein n=1 Tax=Stackebrandtia soli TaxID=1892856 RepID=UPI0039E770AF
MGRIVRDLGDGVTKHYWYPGQKGDWIKSLIAITAGVAIFVLCYVLFKDGLSATTVGACVTTAISGVNLGRRDVGGLREFHDLSAERRAAVADSGRAAWRGAVQGFTCATAAVVVLNMPATGFVADWLLPVIPALVGALAHSAGMVYERMADFAADVESPETVPNTATKALEHA